MPLLGMVSLLLWSQFYLFIWNYIRQKERVFLASHHSVVFKHFSKKCIVLTSLLPKRNLIDLEFINQRKGCMRQYKRGMVGVTKPPRLQEDEHTRAFRSAPSGPASVSLLQGLSAGWGVQQRARWLRQRFRA